MATVKTGGRGLEALLGATLDVQETVYIPRLKTHFTVKALTSDEMRRINERATIPNTRGEKKVDNELLNSLFIAKGCVEPEFSNKALIQHYGAVDDVECVTKALLPGEIGKVLQAVLNVSGFGDEEEMVEDAKN
ncbi:hypothetical protein J2T13_000143 [Paenibacillus sp. DS2015]|uniref:phage tail assembly chaperone n=1 Tax=Paenibacillus sp. DS2015 TaxID=3373917 RepID=UPI003D1DF1F1